MGVMSEVHTPAFRAGHPGHAEIIASFFTSERAPAANSAGRGPVPAAFLVMLPGTQYPFQEKRGHLRKLGAVSAVFSRTLEHCCVEAQR